MIFQLTKGHYFIPVTFHKAIFRETVNSKTQGTTKLRAGPSGHIHRIPFSCLLSPAGYGKRPLEGEKKHCYLLGRITMTADILIFIASASKYQVVAAGV